MMNFEDARVENSHTLDHSYKISIFNESASGKELITYSQVVKRRPSSFINF